MSFAILASTPCPAATAPATQSATTAATTGPATTQHLFQWDFKWKGWEGFDVELIDRTGFKTASELLTHTPEEEIPGERTRFRAEFGLRLETDAAAYSTSGKLAGFDDGVALRRGEVISRGTFQLLIPVDFSLELGYIPHQFFIKELYFTFPEVTWIGRPRFGLFQPPMGLDLNNSSWDLAFMEPAAPLQALAPSREFGIQIGRPVFNDEATWTLGIYGNGPRSGEYGNASKNYGNAIGRVTWLAVDHLHPDDPPANEFVHLGLSANYQYSTTATVRYRARPESFIAPFVIDTGELNATRSITVGGEGAWVRGPLLVEGEFLDSVVEIDHRDSLNFPGFYVLASYLLTGETRAYDRQKAVIGPVIPRRNLAFDGGGLGALEVGCRYSFTDLSDAGVRGGRLSLLMGEMNWYLRPQVKWMFGVGYGNVTGSARDGDLFMFQTRIGLNF